MHKTALQDQHFTANNPLRILFVHAGSHSFGQNWHEAIADQAPPHVQVHSYPLTIPGFKKRIHWETLDLAWKSRHPALLDAYKQLKAAAEGADVLMLYGGYNIHPEFLANLPTYNIYCFYDDPESSDKSSRYLAPAFDAVFYCNVASRFQYQDWGCKRIAFLPIFTAPSDIPDEEEKKKLLANQRDNDIILCCGWQGGEWRKRRLTKLASAFPKAQCFGKGWPRGYIEREALRDLYSRTRIGWNIHNSTGPINVRLFSLTAWNILQICDNKTGLAEVYQLGYEAIGIDTIPEAIEATHYYLHHEDERQAIAQRGFERYWKEYHPTALWSRIAQQINAWQDNKQTIPKQTPIELHSKPAWHYHLYALPHNLKRTIQRWQTSLRKRQADPTWPIDERYYLGEEVPYLTETPFIKKTRACSYREAGTNQHIEAEALAWAATALLGSAQTIAIWGHSNLANDFHTLTQRDPNRTLHHENPSEASLSRNNDLVVTFNEDVSATIKQLQQTTPENPGPPRIILGLNAHYLTKEGGTNLLFQKLSAFGHPVHIYWLPNTIVPWIEPLPGPLSNVSILIETQIHA